REGAVSRNDRVGGPAPSAPRSPSPPHQPPSLSLELRSRGAAGIQPPLQSIDHGKPPRSGRTGPRGPSAFPRSSPNFRFRGVVGWRACHLDRQRRPPHLNDFVRSCVILPSNSPLSA